MDWEQMYHELKAETDLRIAELESDLREAETALAENNAAWRLSQTDLDTALREARREMARLEVQDAQTRRQVAQVFELAMGVIRITEMVRGAKIDTTRLEKLLYGEGKNEH